MMIKGKISDRSCNCCTDCRQVRYVCAVEHTFRRIGYIRALVPAPRRAMPWQQATGSVLGFSWFTPLVCVEHKPPPPEGFGSRELRTITKRNGAALFSREAWTYNAASRPYKPRCDTVPAVPTAFSERFLSPKTFLPRKKNISFGSILQRLSYKRLKDVGAKMDTSDWITLIAAILGLIAVFIGGKIIKKIKISQRQNIKDNGVGIQSGRDTNIGGR